MQPQGSDSERPEEKPVDGRRDDERCTLQTPSGVVYPQGFNPVDGTLCLDVRMVGKGGAAG